MRMKQSLIGLAIAGAVLLLAAGCSRKSPADLLKEANALLAQNNTLEAQIKFDDIIEQHGDSPEVVQARLGLARIYATQSNFKREREQYDILLKKVGGAATEAGWNVFPRKIESYMREGKPQLALREAVETSPSFRQAPAEGKYVFQIMLSELYLYNNDTTTSLKILENQAVHGPDDVSKQFEILNRQNNILARSKAWPRIIANDEAYLKRFPQVPFKSNLLIQIGMNHQEMKDQAKADEMFDAAVVAARQQYEKAVSVDEKCRALMQIAGLHQYRGQYDKEEEILNQLIKEFPQSQHKLAAMFGLSEIDMFRKQPQKAIEKLNEIAKLYPNTEAAKSAADRARQIKAAVEGTTGTLQAPAGEAGATTGTASVPSAPPKPAEAAR